MIDCVLMTDRLVVTVEGKRTEPLSAATDWYPQRSQFVRNLEAAKQLASGRRWVSALISETEVREGSDAHLDAVLPARAPHLDGGSVRSCTARVSATSRGAMRALPLSVRSGCRSIR